VIRVDIKERVGWSELKGCEHSWRGRYPSNRGGRLSALKRDLSKLRLPPTPPVLSKIFPIREGKWEPPLFFKLKPCELEMENISRTFTPHLMGWQSLKEEIDS
jgi:hypothetical protein